MKELIIESIIGMVLVIVGVVHMFGKISLLHSYHRKRVKEEDKKPFGILVGIGCILIGIAILIAGILTYLAYDAIANVVLIVGMVVGIIFIFYAMFKYNKGIF